MTMPKRLLQCLGFVLVLATASASHAADSAAPKAKRADIERGRYIVKITGCNDCHTPGYTVTGGKVAESLWLTGDTLGWRGPWGTTYPPNLRTYTQALTADQWVKKARSLQTRPPMPWWALHDMTEADLRALYQFIRSLGPAGGAAPAFVAPDKEPLPPYIQFPSPPK